MIEKTINLNCLTINQVKLLNNIHEELKGDYNLLIEQIYDQTDGSIDWLVNSLMSRNNHLSNVYLDICYLELIKKIIENEPIKSVIVKSSVQKKTLEDYFREKNIKIKLINSESIFSSAKIFLSPFYYFFKNISFVLLFIVVKNKMRIKNIPKNIGITLIDTFFISSMFENDIYKDRYYSGILKPLKCEDKKNIYFVPTFINLRKLRIVIKTAENATENFIYKFDFLTLGDYIFCLFSFLRIKKIKYSKILFRGVRIGEVLKADFYKNVTHPNPFNGLINYCFMKRLKKQGIKLKLIIDWFENQGVDRGFTKGKNEFYPDVKSIGYEGYVVDYKYNFNLQPTAFESKLGIIPDEIGVIGSSIINVIKKYDPNLSVSVFPAFRFSKIFEYKELTRVIKNKKITILAVLSVSYDANLDIIKLIKKYSYSNECKIKEILICPHPTIDMAKLRTITSPWPIHFKEVNESFSNLIKYADIVVSNTSSACVESLVYGKPVIIVGSKNGITQNPIPDSVSKIIWELCYTHDEMKIAINKLYFDLNKINRQKQIEISNEIRINYFEPLTDYGIKNMLMYK
jgi:hypothetical protein